MSTATPAPRTAPVVPPQAHKNEIRIVSHSTLFYWWPVWALGFLMALVTLFSHQYMVTVPAGTTVLDNVNLTSKNIEAPRYVLVLPKEAKIARNKHDEFDRPHLLMASSKTPGVCFCI